MKKMITTIAICFLLLVSAGIVMADFPDEPLTEFLLVDDIRIPLADGADFSDKQLTGIAYRYKQPLVGVNFSGTHFYSFEFFDAILIDCDFSKAVLYNSSMDCPNHRGSLDMSNVGTGMKGCNFTDAMLTRSSLSGINGKQLESTLNFSKHKDFSDCGFGYSDFSNVDFTGFDLRNTDFYEVKIDGANFTDAKISGMRFSGNDPYNHKSIVDIKIEQLLSTRDFKIGLVKNIHIPKITWPDHTIDLSNMVFIDCQFGWVPVILDENKEKYVPDYNAIKKLPDSVFAKIDLTDSIISGCNFGNFLGLTLENIKSTWNYKHNRMAGIKLPEEIQKALDTEKR